MPKKAVSTHKSSSTNQSVKITEKDIIDFTCGGCADLAYEVQRLTGWPVHCFVEQGGPADHAFVVPKPGWRLDVEGLSKEKDHDKRWGWESCKHKRFSYKKITEMWGDQVADDFSMRRAKEIAPLLISTTTKQLRITA